MRYIAFAFLGMDDREKCLDFSLPYHMRYGMMRPTLFGVLYCGDEMRDEGGKGCIVGWDGEEEMYRVMIP